VVLDKDELRTGRGWSTYEGAEHGYWSAARFRIKLQAGSVKPF
jgi:hypothetical protein